MLLCVFSVLFFSVGAFVCPVTHILRHLSFPPLATLWPSGLQSTANTCKSILTVKLLYFFTHEWHWRMFALQMPETHKDHSRLRWAYDSLSKTKSEQLTCVSFNTQQMGPPKVIKENYTEDLIKLTELACRMIDTGTIPGTQGTLTQLRYWVQTVYRWSLYLIGVPWQVGVQFPRLHVPHLQRAVTAAAHQQTAVCRPRHLVHGRHVPPQGWQVPARRQQELRQHLHVWALWIITVLGDKWWQNNKLHLYTSFLKLKGT